MVTSTPAPPPSSTGVCWTSGATGTRAISSLNAARNVSTSPAVSSRPCRRMTSNWICCSLLISSSPSRLRLGGGSSTGLCGGLALAGIDQDENGHKGCADQAGPDPERDVIAVDRGKRIERGGRAVIGQDVGRNCGRVEGVQQRSPQGGAHLLCRVEDR